MYGKLMSMKDKYQNLNFVEIVLVIDGITKKVYDSYINYDLKRNSKIRSFL